MARLWIARDFGDLDVFTEIDTDVAPPREGEVTIEVRAAGMNPADYKHVARGSDRSLLPVPIGYELSGVITAIGPGTEIATGGGAIGDEVLAFRVSGGYSTALTVAARDVFAKPATLGFEEAACLLLAGATAAEMLHVTGVGAGDTIVVHGASGAVGVSVLQQAAHLGARVIGTASAGNFDVVRRFGGIPVAHGGGPEELARRIRDVAPGGLDPEGLDAALDTVGVDEAVDASLALVTDRDRIVTIAAMGRAQRDGIRMIGGAMPESARFRDGVRLQLIETAGRGDLVVPIAHRFPLAEARTALELLKQQHPGGKVVLIP